ncbi:hypothetical protein CNO18_13480 [Gordonia sp. 1D]|nr:hypothetical protein CNO18_13480 [Gordonia sp. 1D]
MLPPIAPITALLTSYAERLDAGDLRGVAALFNRAELLVSGERIGAGSESATAGTDSSSPTANANTPGEYTPTPPGASPAAPSAAARSTGNRPSLLAASRHPQTCLGAGITEVVVRSSDDNRASPSNDQNLWMTLGEGALKVGAPSRG